MIEFTYQQYVDDVLSGKQAACKWVRLACERHMNDLEHGAERGLFFDEVEAKKAIAFFHLLKHSKGEWAGLPLHIEPWEQFIIAMLIGWKRSDGTRRFRTGYLEVARKNGKTTLAAGLGLYLMLADGEPGAEIYSVAPLDLDTLLPTPLGYTTLGEVQVGDLVFDEDGNPCRVTYISPIMNDRPCYELVFSDGSRVITDAEHRWQTEVYSSGRSLSGRKLDDYGGTRQNSRTTAIYTTEQIKDSLYYACEGRRLSNHRIPIADPLQLPEQDLPIGPYTLGVWLGDGRNNRGSIVIHPDDKEIAQGIQSEGYELSEHGKHDTDNLFRFTVLGLRTSLREHGLLDNKHIPVQFLRASIEQRKALMRGLMDTDGTVTRSGECRFTNRNEALARDFAELVASLGLQPHFREIEVTGSPHYVVSFKAYASEIQVGNLKRKRERQIFNPDMRVKNRYIVAVNPVESRPVRCIGVDSTSHLYLITRSFIATHNTKRDQARISHSEATRMAKSSPAISREVTIYRDNIHILDTASKFEPLGADDNTMDGLNVHGVLADEVHRWKTRDVWDVMETATGSRRQPLMFAITTAGYDRNSLCFQQHEYTCKVLEGIINDDSWFGLIYTIDEDDAWDDESVWIKANPNLGVSKKLIDMQTLAKRAKEMPSQMNAFQRLHLDLWTQSETKWISFEHWSACSGAVDALGLRGRSCYGGLDLSGNTDISAFVLVFPPATDEDNFDILWRYFVPQDAILERARRDRVPYDVWVRQGFITATPGAVIDYEWILHQIDEDAKVYDIREIAFDRWGATKIQTALMEKGGDDWLVQFGQGFASMAPPMKELERLILEHKLSHGNHPVSNWMANNLVVRMDPAGNLKPDKEKSIEKIDGIVAMVMALDRALRHQPPKRSVYEDRGLLAV